MDLELIIYRSERATILPLHISADEYCILIIIVTELRFRQRCRKRWNSPIRIFCAL